MTGLSSEPPNEDMANMAGELIQAKMDMARPGTQITHVLRQGPLHIQVVASKDITLEKKFPSGMDDFYEEFGDKILSISFAETQQRHYG